MNPHTSDAERETATLGGGCFWCLEAVYDLVEGVTDVVSGYSGGTRPNPTYEQVCTGQTGHAEVVRVTFDPSVISFREVLDIFFSIHDPTTLNRQGADVGTQYRSVIFYHNEAQKQVAGEVIEQLAASGEYRNPIVTQLLPLDTFYEAEDYHQEYFAQHSRQPYCRAVISPKVAKFQKNYADKLKLSVDL
jgi:peptide-methionine (S)-S-oxide reductase